MKFFTLLLLSLCTSFLVHAQTINSIEYFFDTDPGYGNGTQLSLNSPSLDSTINFNIPSLPSGVHTLYVRLKNSAGKWSTVYQSNILTTNGISGLPNLAIVEYFYDTDPGYGNGTQLSINGASLDSTVNFLVPQNLPSGQHTLYVRLKTSGNSWSTVYQSSILINNGVAGTPNLVMAEYFYDTDPGIGNGNHIVLNNTTLDSTLNFNTIGLSPGVHTIYIRLKNNSNNWSFAYQGNFVLSAGTDGTPQIKSLEYFFDVDSGVNHNTIVPLVLKNTIDTTLSITVADNGANYRMLGLRLANQTGQSGNVTLDSISLCNLYKPQGGFRKVQYGGTFTLVDTSKYNSSNKINWLANNVLFDTSYITNYVFPANTVGSATIQQITGTGCRVDTVTTILNMPGVESFAPYLGSYNSDFNLNIYGSGLDTTLDVFLKKGDTIIHSYLKFSSDHFQHLIALFDFHSYAKTYGYPEILDNYILHVKYANGYEYISNSNTPIAIQKQENNTQFICPGLLRVGQHCIPGPFGDPFGIRITDPNYQSHDSVIEPFFATDLTGPSSIRTGVWNQFTMSITNTGTVVAKGIPFYIMLPANFDIDTTQWNISTQNPGLRNSISVITPIDTIINGRHLQYKLLAMIYPVLAPGETGYFPLRIRTTLNTPYHIFYTVQSRMFGSPLTDHFGPCLGSAMDFLVGLVPGLSCVYAVGNLINDGVNAYYGDPNAPQNFFSWTLSVGGAAVSCIPASAILGKVAQAGAVEMGFAKSGLQEIEAAQSVLNVGVGGISAVNTVATSSDPCSKVKQTPKNKDGTPVVAFDPNYITGNSDYDSAKHYINNYSPQQYTVGFENKPAATAKAQHVYITDTINNQKFIPVTFKLNQFSIADSVYLLPSYRYGITKDVALKNRNDLKVRFIAYFDTAKGILRADFFSIDTSGHVLPLQSLDGFLPPDVDGISGTGTVSYSIYAQNLNTLDTFSNMANIYFDNNAPIATNKWINTIDTTHPLGKILNAIMIDDSTVKLIMQKSDIGSGVSYHTFYVKNSTDSLFRKMGEAVGDTIIFKGQPNKTYQIFSKATDNVGNVQRKDSVADITITFAHALPLSLLSFTGKMTGERVQLNWITTNEINTSYFDVEKSTDGVNFNKIGTVASLGNTGGKNEYASLDEHPIIGNNFYRLKQVDIDGKFVYSTIVKVYYHKSGFVIIAPNPAKDFVEIQTSGNLTKIQLLDVSGKVVKTFAASPNYKYPLSGISKGLYFIRLIIDNELQTYKLIIE